MESEPFIPVGVEELEQLAMKLKEDLPLSSYVYNMMLHHARKYADKVDFFILKNSPDSHIVLWKNKDNQMALGIHCLEKEVSLLEESLKNTKEIDFKKSLCIFHAPDFFVNLLMDLGKEALGTDMTKDSSDDFIFDENQQLPPLMCPAGFAVKSLGKAGLEIMHSNWRYKVCVPLEEALQVAKNTAALGIYADANLKVEYEVNIANIPMAKDDEIPKSWICATLHGTVGMLMTDENYRGRGFAKLLSQVCAKMMHDKGYFVHTCVERDMPDVKRLYENLPGWSINRQVTWIWQGCDDNAKKE
ncbi:hypothetical protein SK128_025663 [Halocaridina rubra]|uniref:Glycine N-acyltransferase-like protein n=1 Tax=Halocaridina rubra TaxID=373956 RepID=A0AAN8WZB2_HALRR